MKIKWIIYVVLLFSCLSCGYHFSQGGENIDADIQKVFIGAFSNSTGEVNVENYIRNAFFSRFRKGARFTPVADKDKADAVLTGEIMSITTSHLAYSSNNMAKEDRVSMKLKVVFKRTDNGGIIWINEGLSGREAYSVQVDTAKTANNKKSAIRKLSVDMADKAYRNILSGF
ncbi:MAG: hypothetical protein JXB09_05655 [Deltaproteobacteria bacterium]|nr:hypothetical protein [Deltaproteobacteria bacterium]